MRNIKPYKRIFDSMHYIGEISSIKEAVIHVDKYVENIENTILKKIFNDLPLNYDLKKIVNYLEEQFLSYQIKFKITNGKSKNGIIKGNSIDEIITIFCDDKLNKYFENRFEFIKFENTLLLVLKHECVHRGQYLQIQKKSHLTSELPLSIDDIKYYSKPHEIMAYAYLIIEELRFNGISDNDIISVINNAKEISINDSEFFVFYYTNFKNDKKIINLLYKYIYMYLKHPIKIELK